MAYTLDQAFTLIKGAHTRGRLAHAFLITGGTPDQRERLSSKVITLVSTKDGGAEGTDLFGAAPDPVEKSLEQLEGSLVRIVRPQSKSRRIGVDEMRELEKSFYQASGEGNWKVGVVVDTDRMTEAAANAFLKTLEEPPTDSLLLFLTGQPDRLLPTILSRCVNVPLMHEDGGATVDLPDWVAETVRDIANTFRNGFGQITDALAAKGIFANILAERKADVASRYAADLKEETLRYKKIIEGDYLKRREEHFKALTESDYLEERNTLLDGLVLWMTDVARAKTSTKRLDLPDLSTVTQAAAESDSLDGIIRRSDALEDLRRRLETNAMETLALEVAFLDAFA